MINYWIDLSLRKKLKILVYDAFAGKNWKCNKENKPKTIKELALTSRKVRKDFWGKKNPRFNVHVYAKTKQNKLHVDRIEVIDSKYDAVICWVDGVLELLWR